MKQHIVMVFLLLTASVSANDAKSLSATLDKFLLGASINDAEIHQNFWADELVYTSSNGTRFGKQQLMFGVNGGEKISLEQAMIIYTADSVSINMQTEMAILNFVLVATDNKTKEVTQRYLNSGVMVWRDNRWQAINWHATKKLEDDLQDK